MFINCYKKIDKEIRIIKTGIRKNNIQDIMDKYNFEYNKNENLHSLKDFFINEVLFSKQFSDDKFDELELKTNIVLNKINKSSNSLISIVISFISIIISLFIMALSYAGSLSISVTSLETSLMNEKHNITELSNFINDRINADLSSFSDIFAIIFCVVLVGFLIMIVANCFIIKVRRDNYIYYSFVNDCIQLAKSKRNKDNKNNTLFDKRIEGVKS